MGGLPKALGICDMPHAGSGLLSTLLGISSTCFFLMQSDAPRIGKDPVLVSCSRWRQKATACYGPDARLPAAADPCDNSAGEGRAVQVSALRFQSQTGLVPANSAFLPHSCVFLCSHPGPQL